MDRRSSTFPQTILFLFTILSHLIRYLRRRRRRRLVFPRWQFLRVLLSWMQSNNILRLENIYTRVASATTTRKEARRLERNIKIVSLFVA